MLQRFDRTGRAHPLYAEAVRHGGTLYLSGIAPLDEAGRVVGGPDARRQADAVFRTMQTILLAHGAGFADVVKLTVYLRDIADRAGVAQSRARWFAGARPASTLIAVSALGLPDMLLEVDAIAALPCEKENLP